MIKEHVLIYRNSLMAIGDFHSQLFAPCVVDGNITAVYFIAAGVTDFTDDWYFGLKVNGVDVLIGTDRPHITASDLNPFTDGLSIPVSFEDILSPTVDERATGIINGPITVIIMVDDGTAGGSGVSSGGFGFPGQDGIDGESFMIPGPPGAAGSAGAAGPQGLPGSVGPAGEAGSDGESILIPGPIGPVGPAGVAGATLPGNTFLPGEDGQDGESWMIPGPAGAAGSGGGGGSWTTIIKGEVNQAASNTTLTADATLQFAVTANKNYVVRGRIDVFVNNIGFKFDINFPDQTSAANSNESAFRVRVLSESGAINSNTFYKNSTGSIDPAGGGFNRYCIEWEGTFCIGADAGGTWAFRHAQVTSSGSQNIIRGGYVEYAVLPTP